MFYFACNHGLNLGACVALLIISSDHEGVFYIELNLEMHRK